MTQLVQLQENWYARTMQNRLHGRALGSGSRLNKVLGILWCDTETTGLDPRAAYARLLEIAVVPVLPVLGVPYPGLPHAGNAIEGYSAQIHYDDCMSRADRCLLGVSEYVERMHSGNGLWTDCAASRELVGQVDARLVELFSPGADALVAGYRYVLAGDSVHFDLDWIRVHLPLFAGMLSHRVLDVSTLKLDAELRGHVPYQAPNAEPAHRALDDILQSMQACGWLRDQAEESPSLDFTPARCAPWARDAGRLRLATMAGVVPADVHERGWQWRPTAPDTAFAPPFWTIRQCRVCGCLVAGGPTACARCAEAGA